MAEPATHDDQLNSHIAARPGEDSPPKGMSPARAAAFWAEQLTLAEREHKQYWLEADEVYDAYRTARLRKGSGRRRMNLLYANVETKRGAIYARSGRPDVRPRWSGQSQRLPLARQVAEVVERALSYSIDKRSCEDAYSAGILHAILAGRCVVWLDYLPTIEQQDSPLGPLELVTKQEITKTHIERRDFLHSPARSWGEVWWVARRHRMTRDDLRANSFRNVDQIPLNWVPLKDGRPDDAVSDDVKRAEVWEVWSLKHRKRFFVVRGHGETLREDDDPYGLDNFWPMAPPLMMMPDTGNVVPSLEWHQYSQLADDLEEIMNRIAKLTKELKRRGVRDKAIQELERLARANDNEFIPVENYAHLVQKGGLANAFQVEDIKPTADVLVQLYVAKRETEASIDKLSGIADVMRGNVDPQEKLGQTEIKAQFGGLRIKQQQRSVQMWIRDTMRIEAELIAEHFEPHVLQEMTDIEVTPEMIDMMRTDRLRSVAIDVETDSTVFEDSEAQKASVAEAVNAASTLLPQVVQTAQVAPEMTEVIFEMLALSMRALKGGRMMEDTIERARQAMMQRLSAPPPPPQPDPRAEAQQAKAEADITMAGAKREQTEMNMQAARERHAQQMERLSAERAFDQFQPDTEFIQ